MDQGAGEGSSCPGRFSRRSFRDSKNSKAIRWVRTHHVSQIVIASFNLLLYFKNKHKKFWSTYVLKEEWNLSYKRNNYSVSRNTWFCYTEEQMIRVQRACRTSVRKVGQEQTCSVRESCPRLLCLPVSPLGSFLPSHFSSLYLSWTSIFILDIKMQIQPIHVCSRESFMFAISLIS